IGDGARKAVPVLVEALKDKDGEVRVSVAQVLADLDENQAKLVLPVLLNDLKADDSKVRRGAAYVLGQLGAAAKEATPILVKLQQDDPNADVRQAAKQALVKIRGK